MEAERSAARNPLEGEIGFHSVSCQIDPLSERPSGGGGIPPNTRKHEEALETRMTCGRGTGSTPAIVSGQEARSAATMAGQDNSWVTFAVKPSRSPHGEYVFVELAAKPPHGRATAHFQLSRQDAFDLAARLSNAAEWLRREAS